MNKVAKYYAVKKGRNTGVFEKWSDAEEQIKGFSGASYKSFKTEQEANDFLLEEDNEIKITDSYELPENYVEIYVDGSYSDTPPIYGSGWVAVNNDEIIKKKSFSGKDKRYIKSRQVPGEVFACIDAINWAIDEKYEGVMISYDYEGIEKWATKEWIARSEVAIDYFTLFEQVSAEIKVVFRKVKAHSGVNYNEVADKLAKSSLLQRGIRSNRDGGVTLYGVDREELEMVFELIGSENESFNVITTVTRQGCVNFTLTSEEDQKSRIVINCYDTGKTVVQGKESSFMQYTLTLLLQLCESEDDMFETMNAFNKIEVDTGIIEELFNEVLPNYRFTSNKLEKTLKQAAYNLSLEATRYDYSDLPMPILRSIDYYLHAILNSVAIRTVTPTGVNNFSCFDKSTDGSYHLDNGHCSKFSDEQMVPYLNELYNFYRAHRHTLFHWDVESEDTRVIDNLSDAKILIRDGFDLLDKYYVLFNND
ncbi:hypothetical protein FQT00_07665 [Enterococcus faecalis]|nr:viroplasmin family protein [Enterococcus faecalis]MBO1083368.1 hypothetical protein [Enterococcus faecalis]